MSAKNKFPVETVKYVTTSKGGVAEKKMRSWKRMPSPEMLKAAKLAAAQQQPQPRRRAVKLSQVRADITAAFEATA